VSIILFLPINKLAETSVWNLYTIKVYIYCY